jgi:ferredoxin-NADP reductase/ferredoxin
MQSFTSPLLPDDYLELINPLWSLRELRGRIVAVVPETDEAVTVVIKPGWEWPKHQPGQYVRVGVEVDGVYHWRAYSLTSEAERADGYITITPKLLDTGKVSPYLCRRARPGTIVRLGGVEGTFVLPHTVPERLLFISAGSGITPIMSMLRGLASQRALADVVHVHSEHSGDGIIFGAELRALGTEHRGYRLHEHISGEQGRIELDALDQLCADWSERETYMCGPAGLRQSVIERWQRHGELERLHIESFQPDGIIVGGERGAGGSIRLCASGLDASSDGEQPILVAAEQAGAEMPYGCRMGVCYSCVGQLRSGRVRDLRTGRVFGEPGEMLRTCINAPEGAIEIEL